MKRASEAVEASEVSGGPALRRKTAADGPAQVSRALDVLLLRIVDGGLAGSIFLVPLVMGGREALGQLLLVTLAVAAALAWAARGCSGGRLTWRPTRTAALLVAGAALVAFQIVPLPESWLRQLAPHTAEILPLWHGHDQPAAPWGPWRTISLTPAATRDGLAIFLSYGLLFLVAVHRVRSVADVERVLRWCAAAAVGMAILGVAQRVAGNGKFYWFYEHPFTSASDAAKGAFSNRNHFAQFLALGIGPLVWWFQSSRADRPGRRAARSFAAEEARPSGDLQRHLLVLALGIVVFAGLLSLSRGGMVAMLAAGAISTAVCYRARSLTQGFVLGAAAAGLLIAGSLAIFGAQAVGRRIQDLCCASVQRLDPSGARRTIWGAVVRAIPNHWLLGSGVGSHAAVYPTYLDAPIDSTLRFTHAENCYLQVAMETGMAGLALTLGGMALCAAWCIGGLRRADSRRKLVCVGAVAASLAASALHAAVDFVWYVPGCMTPVVLLAACGLRARELAGHDAAAWPEARRFSRPAGLAALAALSALGTWMIAGRVGPAVAEPDWHRYQLARQTHEAAPSRLDACDAQAGGRADPGGIERENQWIGWLQRVVRWQPDHAEAHVELAQCHLRLFDMLQQGGVNAMPLAQLREAALQSRFANRDELAGWLARAVGEHWKHLESALRHARQGLALSPLEGRAYVYLGELAFLDAGRGPSHRAYVDQAVRVRPFDGEVLYAAAMEAMVAGDVTQCVELLQRSCLCGRDHRQRVLRQLVAAVPGEGLDPMAQFIVETFSPGLEDLRYLHGVAAQRAKPEELGWLRRRLAAEVEAAAQAAYGPAAARLWLEAQSLHAALGDTPGALGRARNAYACDPNSYDVRSALGMCLLRDKRFAEAESHLYWCLQRRPEDRSVQNQYREALKGRLDQGGSTAAREGEGRR
jgi:O-antigen ligase/tetratricopeptide (TPR) repeat protein